MEITTKYNVGDKVYFLHNNTVHNMEIEAISVYMEEKYERCTYSFQRATHSFEDTTQPYLIHKWEHEVYGTKEALLKNL